MKEVLIEQRSREGSETSRSRESSIHSFSFSNPLEQIKGETRSTMQEEVLGKDDDKSPRDPNDNGSNERSHADDREDINEDNIIDDDSMEASNLGKSQRVFNIQLKPREPPKYNGSKDMDVVDWATQVKRYLRFVKHTLQQ